MNARPHTENTQNLICFWWVVNISTALPEIKEFNIDRNFAFSRKIYHFVADFRQAVANLCIRYHILQAELQLRRRSILPAMKVSRLVRLLLEPKRRHCRAILSLFGPKVTRFTDYRQT